MPNKPELKIPQSIDQAIDLHSLEASLTSNISSESTLLLALSGGVDSVVLLDILIKLKANLNFTLHAMHVHHGLSKNADRWAAHCQVLCQSQKVPFTIARVKVDLEQGLGVESAAREARYNALNQYQYESKRPDWIVTAHHLDDQVETFFLQLFRGAGVKGLSGMPLVSSNRILRPLLNESKQSILHYAQAQQLEWCEDESNQSDIFDRNFIRQTILPAIETRYPNVSKTIVNCAKTMAESQILLDTLAARDAKDTIVDNKLNLTLTAQMDAVRFHNLLRYWFSLNGLPMPSRRRLESMSDQLRFAKKDANITLEHTGFMIKRYEGHAYLLAKKALSPSVAYELHWQGQSQMMLPNGIALHFYKIIGQGISIKFLDKAIRLKSREGGEVLKLHPNRPQKPLKQWFQEAKIPSWRRDDYPLIYIDQEIASVVGLGVTPNYAALPKEEGLVIERQN